MKAESEMKAERIKAVKRKPGERLQAVKVKPGERIPAKKKAAPVSVLALDLKISQMPLRSVPLASDEFPVVAGGLNYKTTIGGLVSASAGGGITVDTGQPYKIIMLSDGTVKAIPVSAVVPSSPTGLTIFVGLTSVKVSWSIVSGARKFYIYRDNLFLGETVYQSFSDTTVVVGNTYEYKVSTVDQYNQVSVRSAPISATISLALNHAPANVVITCWPNPLPTDGPAFIRVNAHEIDVQNIAYALNVDAGSLRDTDDPSVWILTI